MPKSRHTEAQIIGALRQVEAGRSAADGKYGGMDVSEAQEAKQLREGTRG